MLALLGTVMVRPVGRTLPPPQSGSTYYVAPRGADGNPGSQSLGGFLGFGLIGTAISRLSHPLGVAVAAVGVARTTYASVLGKGRDVRFAADTPIELQLAPGPSPAK